MAEYLPLGTPVHANDTLHRATEYGPLNGQRRRVKRWKRHGETLPIGVRPVDGIVVGVRHLANGWTTSEEYGEEFTRTDGVTAYLIATSLHRAPVLALLEDVTARPREEEDERPAYVLLEEEETDRAE